MMTPIVFYQKAFRWFCNHMLRSDEPLTIVTGANAPFYHSLRDNLLGSIRVYEPEAKVVVWDLGLDQEQLDEMASLFPGIDVRRFDFDSHPEHYKLKYSSYAWKTACIYDTVKSCNTDYILWLDAGCGLKGHLNCVRHILRKYGFFSPYSSTSVGALTYRTVIDAFSIFPSCCVGKQMLNGASVGISMYSEFGLRIIWEWFFLSKDKDLIVPDGSSRENHRQDQSLLSLIYYSHRKQVPALARRAYDFLFHLNKG